MAFFRGSSFELYTNTPMVPSAIFCGTIGPAVAEVVPAGSPRRGRHISDTAGTGMGGVAPAGQ